MTKFNKPTREFYEQDQRATLLRNICLRALDACGDMLATEDENPDALAVLLDTNSQLVDMGIVPNMHVIPPDEPDRDAYRHRMANDPVVASEWIAGQVRESLIGTNGLTDSGSLKTLTEHDELLGEGESVSLVESRNMSPKAQRFVVDLGLTGVLQGFLDYEAGPSELE